MGAVYDFEKEKLIIGVIYHEKEILDRAMEILTKEALMMETQVVEM